MFPRPLPILLIAALLPACQLRSPAPAPADGAGGLPAMRTLPEENPAAGAVSAEARRLIADLLFEGLQALDSDRLLTPEHNNAYDHFHEVLRLQPDNPIARQGMQDIVERYLELALESARRGNFTGAERMLGRAQIIDAAHAGIGRTREAVAAERNSGDLFYPLDERALRGRGDAVRASLAEIAAEARRRDAFVLIIAPDDELARWIYSVMRESLPGHRLRGNIEIAGDTLIRLRLPQS
ncbi:MAG: hypothetical protein OXE54_05950 [Gammaproteobacteria bacterium]|nr:hypothetical protein [Gammaproteobacteria bacterium]MCY4296504.1 hypothetical protein [Gammaproteobacteria bacterium]